MSLLTPPPLANLLWFDRVDSTNDLAARLLEAWVDADNGELEDTIIVASEQSGGHGRGGNSWVSPVGGLYATWIGGVESEQLAVVPVAAGVCCAEAVEELVFGVAVELKWPNDLVAGRRKLGGILCQASGAGEQTRVRIGFGINIGVTPKLAPGDSVKPISLCELGCRGDVTAIIWALVGGFLRRLRPALGAAGETTARWRSRSVHRPGDRLRVRIDERVIEGVFVGFTADGHLELDAAEGRLRVVSGELVAGEETAGE
jgi:biotin-[acetyl-CoA-carboxylase] ligase BirA-like protein